MGDLQGKVDEFHPRFKKKKKNKTDMINGPRNVPRWNSVFQAAYSGILG